MNTPTEILVTGSNQAQVATLVSCIDSAPTWVATAASTDEDAIEKFHHHHFDIVLLTGGFTEVENKKLHILFSHQDPDIIIIRYQGSNIESLQTEIKQALNNRRVANKPTVQIMDDALKNAGININIE